jgi:hypothetical protein
MTANRHPADNLRRTILQYRRLADMARLNAGMAVDSESRDWFLSLAKSMTALADALEEQPPDSN